MCQLFWEAEFLEFVWRDSEKEGKVTEYKQ